MGLRNRDIPKSVRIPTGDGKEHRYDAIQRATDFYGCNQAKSAALACEDVVHIVEAVEDVLEREDLTLEQRREIAETMSSRGIEFAVDLDVETDTN